MLDFRILFSLIVGFLAIVSCQSEQTCKDKRCSRWQRCVYNQVQCFRAPCPAQPVCVSFLVWLRRCPRNCKDGCVLTGTSASGGKGYCRTSNSDEKCPDGSSPAPSVFCGRGPNRQDCDDDEFCHISPVDAFAFCCKKNTGVCPVRNCGRFPRRCFQGKKKDINGCDTCQCCPIKLCRNFCPNGFKKDKYGCKTCQCKGSSTEPSGCPPLRPGTLGICVELCPSSGCPVGQACCSNGCGHVCKHVVKPCQDVLCKRLCRYGFKIVNGCKTCQCNPRPICPVYKCKACPNGYVKDKNGCNTCKCKPAICSKRPCKVCPNGYVKDKNGCDTCKCICLAYPCAPPPRPCLNGPPMDANGCPMCGCKGGLTCATLDCKPGYRCEERFGLARCVRSFGLTCATMRCLAGYRCIEGFGGPRCVPAGGPSCATMRCAPGYRCVETNGRGRCVRIGGPSCATMRCAPGYRCVETMGRGRCVRIGGPSCLTMRCALGYRCVNTPVGGRCVRIGRPSGCAATRCTFGQKCVEVNGEGKCIGPICRPKLCPSVHCRNGWEVDKNGCRTCTCKPLTA